MAWLPDAAVDDTVIEAAWGNSVVAALDDLRDHDHSTGADGNGAVLAEDGSAATPSLRTLGTGSQQAAAGNHGHDPEEREQDVTGSSNPQSTGLGAVGTTYAQQQRVTLTIAADNAVVIAGSGEMQNSTGNSDGHDAYMRILVDGVQKKEVSVLNVDDNEWADLRAVWVEPGLSAASHNFDVEFKKEQGTGDLNVRGGACIASELGVP